MSVVKTWPNFDPIPPGHEYFLPVSSKDCSCRFMEVGELSQNAIQAFLSRKWNIGQICVDVLGRCLGRFKPRSVYHLPYDNGGPQYWILLEHAGKILFVPESTQCEVSVNAHPDALALLGAFAGCKFCYSPPEGYDFLASDSGFFRIDELKPFDPSDPEYLWESDPSVIGGINLFSTSSGDRFLCRNDGSIAFWSMDTCDIAPAFDSVEEFSRELSAFFASEIEAYDGPIE